MTSDTSLVPSERGRSVMACALATLLIAATSVVLRLISRGAILRSVGPEDWFMIAALIFSVGNTIGMVLQAEYALGQHGQDLSLDDIEQFLKAAFYTIIAYNISLTLTKISILLLYLRIFMTSLRVSVFVGLAVVNIYGAWLIFSTVFFCTPVAAFWDVAIKGATCLPKEPKWFADAGLNILTDFGIFFLPLPALRTLLLPRKQKTGLYFIFTLGFFVCIVSILRLYSLYVAAVSTDPTWDHVGVAIWSCIELNTAIVCACVSTLKPLVAKIFPRLLSTTKTSKTGYLHHSNGVDHYPNTLRSQKSRAVAGMTVEDGSERDLVMDGIGLADMEAKPCSIVGSTADVDSFSVGRSAHVAVHAV